MKVCGSGARSGGRTIVRYPDVSRQPVALKWEPFLLDGFDVKKIRCFHTISQREDDLKPDHEAVWNSFSGFFIGHRRSVILRAFVLMGNHFHALYEYRDGSSLAELMQEEASCLRNYLNEHFKEMAIDSYGYYLKAYKYVYRNPVVAGLCLRPEDYRYSTLRQVLGLTEGDMPVVDNLSLIQHPFGRIGWLNAPAEDFFIPVAEW